MSIFTRLATQASAFTSPRSDAKPLGLIKAMGCLAREPEVTAAQEAALHLRSITTRTLTAYAGCVT